MAPTARSKRLPTRCCRRCYFLTRFRSSASWSAVRPQLQQKDTLIAMLQRQLVAIQKQNVEIGTIAARLEVLERQTHASRPAILI